VSVLPALCEVEDPRASHRSGASPKSMPQALKEAAEKLDSHIEKLPQGLKPTFILRHLRHD
jgi:hypothetical protein